MTALATIACAAGGKLASSVDKFTRVGANNSERSGGDCICEATVAEPTLAGVDEADTETIDAGRANVCTLCVVCATAACARAAAAAVRRRWSARRTSAAVICGWVDA